MLASNIAADIDTIESLFVGRRIVGVTQNEPTSAIIVLDDGAQLDVSTIEECCAYYEIASLATTENVITSAQLVTETNEDEEVTAVQIFVYFANETLNRVCALSVEGDPGSGCYGTGFMLTAH